MAFLSSFSRSNISLDSMFISRMKNSYLLLPISLALCKAVSASLLAEELEISYAFLRKIFHVLQKHGVVQSRKGKGGGFFLARSADNILVSDIMEIFQGPITMGNCATHQKVCRRFAGCVLRTKLDTVRQHMVAELRELTIASLLGEEAGHGS